MSSRFRGSREVLRLACDFVDFLQELVNQG